MKRKLLFLKGLLMGFSDIIPGISGGTIALITGIYESLIKNIHDFFGAIKSFFEKRIFSKSIKKNLHLDFFLVLVPGIVFGIIIGAVLLNLLLKNYSALVYGLFSGLIFGSVLLLLKKNVPENSKNSFFLGLGVVKGILLTLLGSSQIFNPTILGILLAGFLGVIAMILPGISGAVILVILGKYEFMLHALSNPLTYWSFIAIFILGCVFGLIAGVKLVKYFLKNHKNKTMQLLIGLMIGALLKTIIISMQNVLLGVIGIFAGLVLFWFFKNRFF